MDASTSSPSPNKRQKTANASQVDSSDEHLSSGRLALSSSALSYAEVIALRNELDEEDLDYETHSIRRALQEAMQSSNSKKDNYSCHVAHYLTFIKLEQVHHLQDHPMHKSNLTAEPLTIAKAKGGSGSVGAESIRQAISALENHCFNHQHKKIYQACPESQKKLQDDSCITAFEKFAQQNEHLCALNAEKMKTNDPISATYTPAQLRKLAISLLQLTHNTPVSMTQSLCDRAIILLCSMLAFHGDSVQSLQLSDLGIEDMTLPAIAPGATMKILTAIHNNAKHNKEGWPETHAALRHLYPETCCIGGLVFYFFGLYHVLGESQPDFAPDFDDPNAGELGKHEWWQHLVFPGNKGPTLQMSYDSQRL
ncbi:hypothetical protein C8R42DRAFT_729579 [Lentinula raphanica]|nr:hypothetical protein C8R42DRAFT_729579 [Lentinula raphanica]